MAARKNSHPRGLSKSKILAARQCPRRLWLQTHHPELTEQGDDQRMRIEGGTRFGELARDLLGDGKLIEHVDDLKTALAMTRSLVDGAKAGTRLFEAAFDHDGVLVRVDALERVRRGWRLTEIKSSTEVKDYHAEDVAVQAWVLGEAGIDLRETHLGVVNKEFVYREPERYDGLLRTEPVDDAIKPLLPEVGEWVAQARDAVSGQMPDVTTGPHCTTPFPCPFLSYCRTLEPKGPRYPVSSLYRGGKVAEALLAEGITDLRKVPLDRVRDGIQRRMVESIRKRRPILEPELPKRLGALPYPRYYLDFETIQFVVPRWLGTRPYQQIPFQFSCHIEKRSGRIDHVGFLDLSGGPPIEGFARALIAACGTSGPILVYNQVFEAGVVKHLAEQLPKLKPALLALLDRFVDLLPLVREHYYHPDLGGSFSIKAVLPAVVPQLRYDQLDGVQHGGDAQRAYLEAIHSATTPARRTEIEAQLQRYCHLDTETMLRLVQVLASGGTDAGE